MNWVDIVVIILLILAFFGGLREGAIRQLFSLLAIVIAIPLAGLTYRWLASLLSFLPGTNWENFLGFYIAITIIFGILFLIFWLPRKFAGALWNKGILFRLGGGILGILAGIIGMVLFTLVVQAYPIFDWLERWVTSSSVLASFVDVFGFVGAMLPELFRRAVTTI
jgi:uncharacterized membrane protein required for colicin V production